MRAGPRTGRPNVPRSPRTGDNRPSRAPRLPYRDPFRSLGETVLPDLRRPERSLQVPRHHPDPAAQHVQREFDRAPLPAVRRIPVGPERLPARVPVDHDRERVPAERAPESADLWTAHETAGVDVPEGREREPDEGRGKRALAPV